MNNDLRHVGKQPLFSGSINVGPLADKQTGPTCGFEAIENLIQLFRKANNDLVETDLLPRARSYGYVEMTQLGPTLQLCGYQPLLQDHRISAQWYPFDYRMVIWSLQQNRGVLVVGNAHLLNPQIYPRSFATHAFVLTNYYTDDTGYLLFGYVGIDSNVTSQEALWSYQNVENAAQWVARHQHTPPVLITDRPVNWPATARHYKVLRTGQMVAVY